MIWALVLVPIVVGLGLYALPRSAESAARWIGVFVAFAAFFATAFGYGAPDESARWFQRPFTANFHVGLGGPAFWIVLLLTLTTGCALLVTRLPRARDFIAQMLVLLGAMTGVFVARDLLLFLCRDNLNLIWSQPKRIEAVGCRRSNVAAVLSDAARENKQVHAAQQSDIGADRFSYCNGKDVERKAGICISGLHAFFQRFHIALAG